MRLEIVLDGIAEERERRPIVQPCQSKSQRAHTEKQRIAAMHMLEALGYTWRGGAWQPPMTTSLVALQRKLAKGEEIGTTVGRPRGRGGQVRRKPKLNELQSKDATKR